MSSLIIQHYVEWLSSNQFKWDTFLHLTSRKIMTVKGYKHGIEKLLEYMGGWGIFGFEYGKIGGCLHVHGIVEGRKRSVKEAWEWWFKRYGRALIEPLKEELRENAIRYICKYAIKSENFEIIGERKLENQLKLCYNM